MLARGARVPAGALMEDQLLGMSAASPFTACTGWRLAGLPADWRDTIDLHEMFGLDGGNVTAEHYFQAKVRSV